MFNIKTAAASAQVLVERQRRESRLIVHPSSIEQLTCATWQFARRTLWRNFALRPSEKELSKRLIREFYENIPAEIFSRAARNYFEEYCHRILLARDYVSRSPLRYIPHPCIYLDLKNLEGFPSTKVWYEKELKQRKEAVRRATNEFFQIFELDRKELAQFEKPIQKKDETGTGFADLFWSGKLIIESKSADKDLLGNGKNKKACFR